MSQDPALIELEKRAKEGDATAARNLALFLELGGTGKPDVKSAKAFWEIAANKGDGFAMSCLAQIVESGADGTKADPNLANQWRAKAGENGMIGFDDRLQLLNDQAAIQNQANVDKIANKILIVDDSDVVRRVVGTCLRNAGYSVIEAVNGEDGLNQLKTSVNVKLIITDMSMPKMSGIHMIAALRKNSQLKDIPVIVLSTESDLELIKQAKALGVAGWVVKPPKPGSLEGIAKRFVGGGKGHG